MRIIVLSRNDADYFRGAAVATHNRIKELMKNFPDEEVEVLMLRGCKNVIPGKKDAVRNGFQNTNVEYDGVTYRTLWFGMSLIDSILFRLHYFPIIALKQLKRFVSVLKAADIVVAHSTYAGYLALMARKEFGVNYTVTWHGSDIHDIPQRNRSMRKLTTQIMEGAYANCFVSRSLLQRSDSLTQKAKKYVLYNGVDRTRFFQMSDKDIGCLKMHYQIEPNARHVAFVGNLFPVKNVLSLPDIYNLVNKQYKETAIVYHFIGGGPLSKALEDKCNNLGILYRLWGDQPVDQVPSIINCMDLVILPSINEGLPLVSVETLACGVPMVGANVGGIVEVIGKDNVVDHGATFVSDMARLIVSKLERKCSVSLDSKFSWEETGRLEKDIVDSIIGRK